jgi:uncharacterized protein (UPF0335 family)
METLGFKELRDFVEKSEMLEISLQDITQQLKQNIEQTKHLQNNGIEIDKVQIKQIIKEVSSESDNTASLLKYLIFANIGFLAGLVFAVVFFN